VNKAESVARQVWQEFSPHDGEELVCLVRYMRVAAEAT
jgi:hypothetical protein